MAEDFFEAQRRRAATDVEEPTEAGMLDMPVFGTRGGPEDEFDVWLS